MNRLLAQLSQENLQLVAELASAQTATQRALQSGVAPAAAAAAAAAAHGVGLVAREVAAAGALPLALLAAGGAGALLRGPLPWMGLVCMRCTVLVPMSLWVVGAMPLGACAVPRSRAA
jgi:hypothetical protein